MPFPEALAWFSLQVAVLIGLVAVLQLVLRRWLTPRWRGWLWGLVVLRLALPVSLSSSWSLFNLLPRPSPPSPAAPSLLTQSPPIPAFTPPAARVQAAPRETSAPATPLPLPAGMANPTPAPDPAPESPALSSRRPVPTARFSLPRVLAMLWAAGFLTVLGLTLAGARRLSRWVSGAQPCADPLPHQLLAETAARLKVRRLPEARELPGLSSPSLYGFLRPQVLLPPGLARRLSARQLRHVLLHELAHVKRHDIALNWVLALLQAVYWFHPLVWWALARLRAERELACDEIALQAAGPDEAEDYGQTILQMLAAWSRPATSPAVVGILEDRRHLRHRLLHIAAFRPGRRTGLTVLLGLTLVGAATLTDAQTPGTGTNAPAQPVPPTGTNLPPVVPLRYTNLLQQAEARDLHSGGNWANAPRGSNVFGGVHFEIDGLVQLASKTSQEAKRGFRPHLTLPAPTNTYGSVHLLAATAWSMENNRTVAEVIWRYTDGTFKRTPLLYAGHVRDWRRRLFED
ncbi:MAG: M56 family metallopeptidase, partial [Verrucomicrobiota bacterium]